MTTLLFDVSGKLLSPFVVASFLRQSSSENLGSCSNSDTCHTLLVGVASCRLWVYKRARRSCSSKNLRFMRAIINANEMPSLSKHLSFHTFFCMRGEFHLAHLSTLKGLAASCSEWEIHVNSLNSEFQLHWDLSFSSFFSKTLSNIVSSSFNVWMI